jgi:hypothetical protein
MCCGWLNPLLNDRRAGIMSFVGPNTCVGNFESIEITPDLSLDPSPEITGGKLKNLLTSEEIALKDGNLCVTACFDRRSLLVANGI